MRIYSISGVNTSQKPRIQSHKQNNYINFQSGINRKMAADLRVFYHHIYEYKKGIRNLILTTEKAEYKDAITERLEKEKIAYKIDELNGKNINVYFGADECVDVIKTLNPRLSEHTAEEDFILGILLGYDRVKQCSRYLRIKNGDLKIGRHGEP